MCQVALPPYHLAIRTITVHTVTVPTAIVNDTAPGYFNRLNSLRDISKHVYIDVYLYSARGLLRTRLVIKCLACIGTICARLSAYRQQSRIAHSLLV
jgi:hypothetical protein